jgi:hypothetical protein
MSSLWPKLATSPADPPPTASEQEIVVALQAALGPIPVWWGYGPQELVEVPPSLPLVIVVRTSAVVRTEMDDMCEDDTPLPADVTLQVRVWCDVYSTARSLQKTVRSTLRPLGGWREQSEFDTRDGDLRAWCIASDWMASATALE